MSVISYTLEKLTPLELELATIVWRQGGDRRHWQCQIKSCYNRITFREIYVYDTLHPARSVMQGSKKVCDRHAREFADKHRIYAAFEAPSL
jgi:hypothetical protein